MARKKKASLNDYANQASIEGMTYGQKQAKEYIECTRISEVPCGYRKAGYKQQRG